MKLLMSLDLETNHHNKPRFNEDGELVLGLVDTKILEIGFIIYELTTINDKIEMKEVYRHQSFIYHPLEQVWPVTPDVVLELHTKSGFKENYDQFVKDCEYNSVVKGTFTTEHVDEYISCKVKDFLIENYPAAYDDVTYRQGNLNAFMVIGKNPQFDLSLINTQMPLTAMFLGYSPFDVNIIKNIFRNLGHYKFKAVTDKPSTHKAIEDCESASDHFQTILEVFSDKFPDNVEYFKQYLINQE